MNLIEPQTPHEFELYYYLRWEVLRKPWGKPIGSEKDELENGCVHAMIVKDNQALAVGRLQFNSSEDFQIRFMGVRNGFQNMGLGTRIISYLESKACERKAKKIILHARENALAFYERRGYRVLETSFLLWGEIQHYLMEKTDLIAKNSW